MYTQTSVTYIYIHTYRSSYWHAASRGPHAIPANANAAGSGAYVCMYVCMFVCIYECMYVCMPMQYHKMQMQQVPVRMYACKNAYFLVQVNRTWKYLDECKRLFIKASNSVDVFVYICLYVRMYVQGATDTSTHMYTYTYTYIHTYAYTSNMDYIHTHIHTHAQKKQLSHVCKTVHSCWETSWESLFTKNACIYAHINEYIQHT